MTAAASLPRVKQHPGRCCPMATAAQSYTLRESCGVQNIFQEQIDRVPVEFADPR